MTMWSVTMTKSGVSRLMRSHASPASPGGMPHSPSTLRLEKSVGERGEMVACPAAPRAAGSREGPQPGTRTATSRVKEGSSAGSSTCRVKEGSSEASGAGARAMRAARVNSSGAPCALSPGKRC
jgi:hypothetical protein